MTSSASWKATPTFSPNRSSTWAVSSPAPENTAPYRAEVAMREPVLSASTWM